MAKIVNKPGTGMYGIAEEVGPKFTIGMTGLGTIIIFSSFVFKNPLEIMAFYMLGSFSIIIGMLGIIPTLISECRDYVLLKKNEKYPLNCLALKDQTLELLFHCHIYVSDMNDSKKIKVPYLELTDNGCRIEVIGQLRHVLMDAAMIDNLNAHLAQYGCSYIIQNNYYHQGWVYYVATLDIKHDRLRLDYLNRSLSHDYDIALTKSVAWNAMKHINGLIGGVRGSGKSFFVLGIIKQLATLKTHDGHPIPTQIYAIDFKNSDIARLKVLLPDGRVATNKEDALKLLEHYLELMKKRIDYINKVAPFGSTAASLKMPLYYLVVDEWSATNAAFDDGNSKEDKADRYHWHAMIHELMMLGRMPGFGIIIISQQLSVGNAGLSSALHEEAGMIAHMGPATMASYRLTFGNEINVPDVSLDQGQGLVWLEGATKTGYVLPFAAPIVNLDTIWKDLEKSFELQNDELYVYQSELREKVLKKR